MTLDLTPFNKALSSLHEALEAYKKEPSNKFILDSCIQRFEYTYEISWKMLKRYLEATSAAPGEVDEMAFADLIRTGSEKGLLLSGWDKWKDYREARGTTSHTYDEKKAQQVFAKIPAFYDEARHLCGEITKRQS
jgi:nucleotidyltransferase substrate binding protein (TIGR01987 family)